MWAGTCVLSWSGLTLPVFPGRSRPLPQAFPNISPSTPCHGAHLHPGPRHPGWGRCGPILPLRVLPLHSPGGTKRPPGPSRSMARRTLQTPRTRKGDIYTTKCAYGGGCLCVFFTPPEGDPLEDGWVFKLRSRVHPCWGEHLPPTRAHGPQECGVAMLPPRDEGPALSFHSC